MFYRIDVAKGFSSSFSFFDANSWKEAERRSCFKDTCELRL
jgi:hypothetical protein